MARVALGTVLVPWFIAACNSPTLPTPPPVDQPFKLDIPDAELASDGEHVVIIGAALPGATVMILNRTLLETNIDDAIAVALASQENGRYQGTIRVDLRCSPTNVIDITQRDNYGQDSEVRRFAAPNGFGDASLPPSGGAGCPDGGEPDGDGGERGDAGDAGDAGTE